MHLQRQVLVKIAEAVVELEGKHQRIEGVRAARQHQVLLFQTHFGKGRSLQVAEFRVVQLPCQHGRGPNACTSRVAQDRIEQYSTGLHFQGIGKHHSNGAVGHLVVEAYILRIFAAGQRKSCNKEGQEALSLPAPCRDCSVYQGNLRPLLQHLAALPAETG